ncbi:Fe-S cluster assembly protein IscX [Psychromonas sp. CD1]|uniref:Fe-S cluster assembly protein IscX n=1 Tax=Psychromonas sp. CD1 TaxID=1979839 RepID=UPI000B9C0CC5|nr:Fe-S cluster assembly protein IscX [Psychromonas sp. CD1]
MGLKWIDSLAITLALIEQHPQQDPCTLHFVELREWILALSDFDDDIDHCSERILEAVQQCWIDEI